MSELVERRRSTNQHNLRRSKSVRESLRMIGTKLLHHRHDVRKSPSLSNIADEEVEECENNHVLFDAPAAVRTILKTPMEGRGSGYLRLPDSPLKENLYKNPYAIYKAKRVAKYSESDVDKIDEEDCEQLLRPSDFNRGSFRLSMSAKRRTNMWSSFSSTSSTYLLLQSRESWAQLTFARGLNGKSYDLALRFPTPASLLCFSCLVRAFALLERVNVARELVFTFSCA